MLEFVGFKERLTQSHARAVAYVESAMLALTSASPAPAAAAAQVANILSGSAFSLLYSASRLCLSTSLCRVFAVLDESGASR